MNLLDDLKEVYANEGKIEDLNASTGNQKAIDRYNLKDQSILINIIDYLKANQRKSK